MDEIFFDTHILLDQGIDGAPVEQPADVAVVDEKIGFDFARKTASAAVLFFKVGIDSIEVDTALFAIVHGLLEQPSFSHAPEDEAVAV